MGRVATVPRLALTADRVRHLFDLVPETGALLWVKTRGRVRAGDVAGWIEPNGYRFVSVDGLTYLAHRIVWLHSRGAWPAEMIDHINGQRCDNRPANLRDVSAAANQHNRARLPKSNTSGFLGVTQRGQRWEARLSLKSAQGGGLHLGRFATAQAAHAAYLAAKRVHHEGYVWDRDE